MSVLGVAIFMGCYYSVCRLRLGYTFSSALLQPVTIAVFVGLITGDMANAMKIGAGLQLVYLGVTSTPGGNVPSDPALAGCIAIPLGVAAGMNPETAIALAIPFGVLGVFVDQLRRTTNSIWVHMADKYAEKADTKGIMRAAFLYPAIAGFIIRFPKGKDAQTGYQYEPWHLRYLGIDMATKVYNSGLSLEEYLGITSEYAD